MPDAGELAHLLSAQYAFERELGRGGMATVWLVHDRKHDRRVALKVLRPELAATLGRERFLQEVRNTARLQHPHILPLLDSGETNGQLWYTMPYVEGETLRHRLAREGRLPLAQVRRLVQEVGGALSYAHAHGIIHRDVKPENVLLSEGGALVADFGIARAIEGTEGQRMTSTGFAVGTPAYMSPEQSVAQRDLDGRSDLYSLACMAYEALAGEPPLVANSPQAIVARRFTEPVPSVRDHRPDVPEETARVLGRALARDPADRFGSVAEFVEALETTAPTPPPQVAARRPARLVPIGLALGIALLGGAAWLRFRSAPPAELDVNVVAVAPFEILAPALENWREGMVDVMSRYLDGAGPLRTVAPSKVILDWHGRADRASAEQLGRQLGAGTVVFGDIMQESRDTVRLRATILPIMSGRPDVVEVRGPPDRIGQLTDSLGRSILEVLGRDRPIAAVAGRPIGSGSLPALKLFLQGEQFFRRSDYDSALAYYERATAMDSLLGIAYLHMHSALSYSPPSTGRYQAIDPYMEQAYRTLPILAGRDSLLVVGSACLYGREGAPVGNTLTRAQYGCAIGAAREAVRRYPTDPESWFLLGEIQYHQGRDSSASGSSTMDAFVRVITLDSSFAPGYEHIVDAALKQGRMDVARDHARLAAARARGTASELRYALTAALLEDGPSDQARIDTLLTRADNGEIWNVLTDLAFAADSGEAAIRVSRAFHSGSHRASTSVPWVNDSVLQRRTLASLLALRGHLGEAAHLMRGDAPAGYGNPSLSLVVLGALSRQEYSRSLQSYLSSHAGPLVGRSEEPFWRTMAGWQRSLEWLRLEGDSTGLRAVAARFDSLAPTSGGEATQLHWYARLARSYLSLVRGDTSATIAALTQVRDSGCAQVRCVESQLVRSDLLARTGRLAEAARLLDEWMTQAEAPLFPLLLVRRGSLAEQLHDSASAVASYQRALAYWRDPDPGLDSHIGEARAGLQRLKGKRQAGQ